MQSLHFVLLLFVFLLKNTVDVDAFIPRATSTAAWGVVPVTTQQDKTSNNSKDQQRNNARSMSETSRTSDTKTEKKTTRATTTTTSRSATTDSEMTTSSPSPKRIIIAGAPASGKGTQCEKITATYGVVHLSTGDMLRAAVAAGTEIGMEAKQYMDSGKLVPDSTMIGIVKDRLQQEDCQTKGWLLDGFPRTQAQAKALEEAGICADCFIFLNVPDDVLVERVIGRRTDPVTGKIYHMTFSPPTDQEVIARLQHRSDDTEEKVKVRLEQFHANVDAVKGSYSDISITIDGNQNPTVVTEQILEAIGSLVAA